MRAVVGDSWTLRYELLDVPWDYEDSYQSNYKYDNDVRKEYPVLLNRLIKSNSDINISTSNTDDDIDSSAFDDTDDNNNNSYSSECNNNKGKLYIACYNLLSDVI